MSMPPEIDALVDGIVAREMLKNDHCCTKSLCEYHKGFADGVAEGLAALYAAMEKS